MPHSISHVVDCVVSKLWRPPQANPVRQLLPRQTVPCPRYATEEQKTTTERARHTYTQVCCVGNFPTTEMTRVPGVNSCYVKHNSGGNEHVFAPRTSNLRTRDSTSCGDAIDAIDGHLGPGILNRQRRRRFLSYRRRHDPKCTTTKFHQVAK